MQRGIPSGSVGLGLRAVHYADALAHINELPWLEVHTENYLGGGTHLAYLQDFSRHVPLSFHCVALSLGSAEGVDPQHLARIKALVDRFSPALISDHVSWSRHQDTYVPDLLPLPYTPESFDLLSQNIQTVQQTLGRQILIENPSTYLTFHESTIAEWDFLNQVCDQTGCGLLLDVNNIYVSACNQGVDALPWLSKIHLDFVQEIHLAGHTLRDDGVRIDTHSTVVSPPVWDLYAQVMRRRPDIPTLMEWDTDMPPFSVLLDEKKRAEGIIAVCN